MGKHWLLVFPIIKRSLFCLVCYSGRSWKIIITTLDIPACIKDVKAYTVPVDLDGMNESMNTFNTKSENRANVVGQQLLLNLIKESNR